MNIKEYTIDLFKKNYEDIGNKDIVIYGLGKQTQYILEAFPELPIVGLLDGFREDGEFCGKKIISLEMIKNFRGLIIIVARKASEKIIHERIKSFCKENHIEVRNLSGELLEDKDVIVSTNDYFIRNKQELLETIKKHEVISFDIFDTLLTRKVSSAEHLFYYMGALPQVQQMVANNFAGIRITAEKELSLERCPDINEIYARVGEMTGISPQEQRCLIELELSCEKKLLIPRDAMVCIFNETVDMGKSVYLISDMYWTKDILEKILKQHGISGYKEIFVSCEYNTKKTEELYRIYKEKSHSQSMLHIGDSEEADGYAAEINDIHSYLIKRPYDMFELSDIDEKSFGYSNNLLLEGFSKATLFNDPFCMYNSWGKVYITMPYRFGYGFLGPLLLGFTRWQINFLQKENIDRIFFISRDGFLIKKFFDILCAEENIPIKSDYLHTSRTLSVAAALKNKEDIHYASSIAFHGYYMDMLQKRFHLMPEECKHQVYSLEEMVDCYGEKILLRSKELRENYLKYLDKFQLKETEQAAIFDFVSKGTCQRNLEEIWNRRFQGVYFQHYDEGFEDGTQSNAVGFINDNGLEQYDYDYFLIEMMIKEPVPSLREINDEGNLIYCKNYLDKKEEKYILEAQQGALDMVEDYLRLAGPIKAKGEIDFSLHLLEAYRTDRIKIRDSNFFFYDEFTERRFGV